MSGSARIQVTAAAVAEGWQFTLTCPQYDNAWSPERVVEAFPEPPRYPVPRLSCAAGCDHSLCEQATSAGVEDALARLDRREDDGRLVGRYLFDTLLGADWAKVTEIGEQLECEVLELALTWPYRDNEGSSTSSAAWLGLSQLPWELMRDESDSVLASAGRRVSVAVTRVVEGSSGTMRALGTPPRVLFVVGTTVADSRVRAGAEMLGLLREVRKAGRRLTYRILQNARPDRLEEAVRAFRPDIVHVISHGELDADGRGHIWLESDYDDEKWRTAEQLLEFLTVDGQPPPVVILSACDSAGKAIMGPRHAAPFAAELVFGGVPVVVAMAGTVSDRACRVFTRYFGRALAAGESLVEATAEARRLAFAQTASTAADWALPSVFFSADVIPDEVRAAADPAAEHVDKFVASANLTTTPVFCAREEFLEAFWAMLGDERTTGWEVEPGQRPSVLAICHLPGQDGVGKTRLLHELAKQALLNGHLPLLLGADPDRPVPVSLRQLADELAGEMSWLGRQVLRLDGNFGAELTELGTGDPTLPGPTPGDAVATLADALESDFDELCQAAQAKYPEVFADSSRAVVLIDNMGENCVPLLTQLFERRSGLKAYGLGASPDRPVPVVLVIEFNNAPGIRHDLGTSHRNAEWLVSKNIKPFDDRGEDMLAYELVLMHPFRSGGDELTRKQWIFNRDPDKWEKGADTARAMLKGKPILFDQDAYEQFIAVGVIWESLVSADDSVRPEAVG